MHLKRQGTPKKWPLKRKGTKYIVRPRSGKKGLPVLVLLRDILKVAQNRKEVKKAIHENKILLNIHKINDEKNPVFLNDVITIVPSNMSYRLSMEEKGKFKPEQIKENEANQKVSKVIGKKRLKGKKIQLNLSDGKNFLSEIKCEVEDSVLINFKEKKIEKCIPLKEKNKALIFAGKHAGKKGIIEKIDKKEKIAEIKTKEGKINVLIKQMMVVE